MKTNENCIFCKIIAGEVPADKIYEDEDVVAFMDIRPVSRGHALVVPKVHSDDFLSTNDEVLEAMIPKIKKLAQGVMRAMVAEGINISTNHGLAAGQSVFHLHFHLIPRFAKDGLEPWPHMESEPKSRAEIAEFIKKNL
ncbi:MAG TPA: HIT family protein [Methylomirabilota bacterium]|nr:HIT family protein [Methylomirabilota bacterium]